jgi:hypothetical protein
MLVESSRDITRLSDHHHVPGVFDKSVYLAGITVFLRPDSCRESDKTKPTHWEYGAFVNYLAISCGNDISPRAAPNYVIDTNDFTLDDDDIALGA